VAYDLINCVHPDTTVAPYLIDLYDYPGYMLGGAGAPDIDGDGLPDAPFAIFDDQFSSLTAWSTYARSEYHALQLTLRKRMSHGVGFDFNYTFSKSLDMSSVPERSGGLTGGFLLSSGYTSYAINSWDPKLEYSYSDFDMRHQMNADFTVDFPIGRARALGSQMPAWLDHIIGGWQISGIVRVNSSLPTNIVNGRRWPTNWEFQGNATCGPSNTWTGVAPCPSTQNSHGATHAGIPDTVPNLWSDPDQAFQGVRWTLPGERGERNIIRGDKFFDLDLGLAKAFKMPWEGHTLKLRWETFNVTNSVFFDVANMSANIGRKATFGDYSQVLGGPRRMQISLRYEF
jgi:hypothetical protein